MKRLVTSFLVFAAIIALQPLDARALSLKINPTQYRTVLTSGEKQKGYVDVSNPSGEKVIISTSVQGFRQVDDSGTLEFFDSEQLRQGIVADLQQFELAPRAALRMYFLVDGAKLPPGEVFGAIFFTTGSNAINGTGQAVRLGTLLSITNGTAASHKAEVTNLAVNFFQFGQGVVGSYGVKNTGTAGSATGFYPEVRVSISPFAIEQNHEAKLVFPGRERSTTFSLDTSRFGFFKLRVQTGESYQEKWVFITTGYWQGLIPLLLILTGVILGIYLRIKRYRTLGGKYRSR